MNWVINALTVTGLYIIAEFLLFKYVDIFEKPLPYELAWFFRFASKLSEPGPGCQCCKIPDRLTAFHTTEYKRWTGPFEHGQLEFFPDDIVTGGGRGISYLCESCWENLTTDERLAYYLKFASSRNQDSDEHQLIVYAVLAGK